MCTGIVERVLSKCWHEQVSTLSPLFIAVVELINRKIGAKDILRKLMYADDLAVVADGEANLQEQLIEWKDMFSTRGLRVSLEKTQVMWVGPGSWKYTWMEKKLKQRDSFV